MKSTKTIRYTRKPFLKHYKTHGKSVRKDNNDETITMIAIPQEHVTGNVSPFHTHIPDHACYVQSSIFFSVELSIVILLILLLVFLLIHKIYVQPKQERRNKL